MPAVTTAAEMLIYAAEREIDWTFLARMAVLKALDRREVQQFQRAPLGQVKAKENGWPVRFIVGLNLASYALGVPPLAICFTSFPKGLSAA